MKREFRIAARARARVVVILGLAAALLLAGTGEASFVTVVLSPVADASIQEENPDASDGKSPGLFAGRTRTDFVRRALIRFDLTGIPTGLTISSVDVRMTLTRANSGSVFGSLHRVTSPWSEGTADAGTPGGSGAPASAGDPTWTMRSYPGTAWTAPGGDAVLLPSATALIGSSLVNYVWTSNSALVADVQGWVSQPSTNFGWQLRMDEAQIAPTAKRFGSREQSDPALGPVLSVTYNDPSVGAPASTAIPALDARALAALAAVLAAAGVRFLRRT